MPIPKPMPSPVPPLPGDKQTIQVSTLTDWQPGAIAQAVKIFAEAPQGKAIAEYFNSQKVEFRWTNEGFTDGDRLASVNPVGPDGKRIIYLSSNPKPNHDILMNGNNRTFLASVIAHETTHLQDFETAKISDRDSKGIEFILELNAKSNEVQIYNWLRKNGKAPEKEMETSQIEELRLYADIYNHLNGGPELKESDYPLFTTHHKGIPFEKYLEKAYLGKTRTGAMALSGVVKELYGFQDAVLTPSNLNQKERMKYAVIQAKLLHSFCEYNKWASQSTSPSPKLAE